MTKQMIVTTMANGQPQQVIIAGTNQQITLNKGMVIATTASVPTQGQPQQQTIQLQSSQQPQNQQQQHHRPKNVGFVDTLKAAVSNRLKNLNIDPEMYISEDYTEEEDIKKRRARGLKAVNC